MDDLNAHLRMVMRVSLLLMSATLLLWASMVDYRSYAAGFALGLVVSLINTYYLGMKIKQMTILITSQTGKRFNLGFMTRAAMAILVVMLAHQLEGTNVYATVGGLFTAQFIAAFVGIFSSFKRKK
ncbi:ATP synthase subunit I [Paenibacillus oceani]|uniref:ATP synthase subunit I n=1 Tax=Paenibacillus oceani TaxID=2772510 RepID=A0A927H0R9_9BACL|nr:ATP synthase subunit I [Paenibacillus oceani]MBD2863583.1 ATP synthase subunit I [Paenibacillus oceani]